MKANKKSTRKPTAAKTETPEQKVPFAVAGMLNDGLQRIVQMQKNALDLAAQQNAEVVQVYKKVLRMPENTPGVEVIDFAVQAFDSFVNAQKTVLDLVCQQSNAMLEHTKERGETYSKLATEIGSMANKSIDRAVAAHETILNVVSQQNKAATEAVKKQVGVSGTRAAAAADSVNRGVEALIETEKNMVDAAIKPLKTFTAKV